MLPRHLRRAIPAPAPLRLAAFAASTHRSHALAALHYRRVTGATAASFHSSSRRRDELPKSPFQTFVDVLRDELRKNRELQENVKQLQGDVDKLQDSEAMRKARAAYERARVRFSFLHLRGGFLLTGTNVFLPAYLEHQREPAASGCR
jgi:import inner membrane translocase subunit TIM44